jgi:hypothetical protein
MSEKRLFSRRKFLIGSAATLGGVILSWTQRLLGIPEARAQEPELTPRVYLPIVFGSGELSKPRVLHVRDADATNWNGTDSFYDAVKQDVVDAMVRIGLQLLTGQGSWPDIWGTLFLRVHPSGYSAGQKIAIKVNLVNSHFSCDDHDNRIDALPQPVLALISGLVAVGVQTSDITVYDSVITKLGSAWVIPDYFRGLITATYPEVRFVGPGSCPGVIPPSHGKDPSLTVRFNDPDGNLEDRQLVDVLYDATYVINIPVLKCHSGDGEIPVTLGFKNHVGSLNIVSGRGDDNPHKYMVTSESLYRAAYNPLVDIYSNTNIRAKTVLTLGDGLYGAFLCNSQAAVSWSIFGGACNSFFFGTDPVATDCVMADMIVAEGLVSKAHTYDYLFCAEEAGLGVCEGTRDDPGGHPLQEPYGSGYDDIEYVRVDM